MEIGPDSVLIFVAAIVSVYIVTRVWRYIWAGLLVFAFYALYSWLLLPFIGTGQTADSPRWWSSGDPVGAAALVLSHFAAVPAAVFLVRRHAWTTLTVLSVAVLISTAYHMCQVGWMCFGSTPVAFQISDHFTVYFSIAWFLLWGSGAPERVVMSATIAITGLMLPLIVSDPGNWLSGILIISAAATGFLICYSIYTRIRGKSTVNWLPLAAALIMIAAGSVFHVMAGDFEVGNTLYPIAHTIWHIFALVALYFAAMVRYWGPSVAHVTLPVRRAASTLTQRTDKPRRDPPLTLADIRLDKGWQTKLQR